MLLKRSTSKRSGAHEIPGVSLLGFYRDRRGMVRLIEPVITLDRLVKGATDKIRQAGMGMPAIYIRQLKNFTKLVAAVSTAEQRDVVLRHANMILQAGEETVREEADRHDIRLAYDALVAAAQLTGAGPA